MKCSVCAKNIPEDRYSEHLESEHGVTDDPTAVLIQHLSGLGSKADEDGEDALPDEEPSDADADAFEQFLADHPADPDEEKAEEEPAREPDAPEPAAEEPEEEPEPEPEPEPAREPAKATAAAGAAGAAADVDADTPEDAGDDLTDEDQAEFERMLAAYPDVDLRKGRPKAPADPAETTKMAAAGAAGAAVGVAAGAGAGAPVDTDDKTFAVWDEARGAAAPDDDLLVVAPPVAQERARRRRQAALLILGAAVILIAIAVVYLLTRDTGTTKKTVATPATLPPITVAPTFLPGPQGGVPTTVPDTTPATQAPVATPATPTTAAPATTAPPSGDPASQIAFTYIDATCQSGQLQVRGGATNNNAQTYSFSFVVQIVNASGSTVGNASGSVAHLPPHAKAGFVAVGQCTDITGGHPQQQITSITAG